MVVVIATDHSSVVDLTQSPQQATSYWKCRKSLRLWPIREAGSLVTEVRKFLVRLFQHPADLVEQDFGQISVEHVIDPRSKIKYEVSIEFASQALRDSIKGSG